MPTPTRVVAALAACLLTPALHAPAAETTAPKSTETAPAADHEGQPKKRRSNCAFRRLISGFKVIDDSHFVLEAGRTEFLVTLTMGCYHLDFETVIAIRSLPAASICVEEGDRVILDRHYSCLIRKIEGVENMDEARRLVAERAKKKQDEKEKEREKEKKQPE